jgi:thiamine biosynthesis lipoprotein
MKRILLVLSTFLIFTLYACSNQSYTSVEEACGVPISTFQNTPAMNTFETSGLRPRPATLTGYFDTLLSLTLYVDESVSNDEFKLILECVEMIYKEVHQLATNYDAFEGLINVYAMNQNPGITYSIDPLLADIIRLGLEYGDITDGLFDISLGRLLNVWNDAMATCNQGGVCEIPSKDVLINSSNYIGSDRITLIENQFTALEGTQIDLGGVAKGYAAALVGDYLRWRGDVKGFLLNAGTSNIEVYGLHPTRDNQKWLIGLRHPEWSDIVLSFDSREDFPSANDEKGPQTRINYFVRDTMLYYFWNNSEYIELTAAYARVFLESGEHIVTAGDYQRFFEVDGVMYHHILDPRTLSPGQKMRSITMIGPNGILGDVLSTAAFLMEPLEAIAFAETFGFQAILYTLEGEILMSETLNSRIEINHD